MFPRRGLEKHQAAGFFVRIHPGGAELIAGTYMPGPGELRALRRYLATHHKDFRKLATAPALTKVFGALEGERLVRVPAPYDADHPAADLLRLKQFYFRRELGVADRDLTAHRQRDRSGIPRRDSVRDRGGRGTWQQMKSDVP